MESHIPTIASLQKVVEMAKKIYGGIERFKPLILEVRAMQDAGEWDYCIYDNLNKPVVKVPVNCYQDFALVDDKTNAYELAYKIRLGIMENTY